MTGYPIMEPPFLSFPIEEMKKKQVEQHFNWYMAQIEGRIKQLNEFINLENKELVLDKTPESLIDLWEWFQGHIEYEDKTEEEINKSCEGQPEWFQEILRKSTKKMTLLTMALAEDIAIYFSETMIHNHPQVHWGYLMKPKKLDGAKLPILLGFECNLSANPRNLVSVCIYKSTEKKNKYELYETYNIWVSHVI